MKHMNSQMLVCAALAGAASMFVSGCSSTRSQLVIDEPPEVILYGDTVSITAEDLTNLEEPVIPSEDDPREIIQFALSLSQRGRHLHAATFLEEAAERFQSRNNDFALSCLAAAANEYLHAGKMDEYRAALRQLESRANRYQHAAFGTATLSLLTLGEIANGGTRPNELTPKALRDLYPGY